MRLISIGKSASCTVCIPNEYVSSYHAEILLMDNGDIFLTDCNSKNGTFLNGKRIASNVEVPVRRGDRIEFDTVSLNWGSIPQIPLPDPSKVKGVYGVGKNQRNRYNLNGESVSRYHATFKEMKNGKWFIQDHSKNGTFINGNRIPSNQDIQIKASDSIVCGSVPCPNPIIPPSVPKWVWGAVCAVALVVIGIFAVKNDLFTISNHVTDPYKATVLVNSTCYFTVKFADDPILGTDGHWYFSTYYSEYPRISTSPSDAFGYSQQGTAFFISDKGLLLTNKHVINRIYADEQEGGDLSVKLKRFVEQARENYIMRNDLPVDAATLWLKSAFTISVEPVSFGIRYPGRAYTNTSEMDWAHLVKESDDPQADIAILRLNSSETPKDRDWFDLKRSRDISDLKLNTEEYYTVGFPLGEHLATVTDKEHFDLTSGILHLAKTPSKHLLYLQGDKTVAGQSGSPIYDKKSRLIGVLYGGYKVPDNTNACPIVHAQTLVQEIVQEDTKRQIFKSNNAGR